MKVFVNSTKEMEAKPGMIQEHLRPKGHIPPHERRMMVYIDYSEQDWEILTKVFGDEDTASAAVEIIRQAPPEIQILITQTFKCIKEVEENENENN